MSIAKFNKDYFETGIGFLYYCFIRAWPLSISSTPVNYDSGSILKLNVTFRYERYVMENVTKGMIRSGWKGYSDSFDPWMGQYGSSSFMPKTKSYNQKDKTSVNPTNSDGYAGGSGNPTNKRGSVVKDRGRKGGNFSGAQQQNERGSGFTTRKQSKGLQSILKSLK